MRKFYQTTFIVLLGLFIVSYFLFNNTYTTAQESQTVTSFVSSCFTAKSCEDDDDANCIVEFKADGSNVTTKEDHMAQLTLAKDEETGLYELKPNFQTFVTECFSTGTSEICTTGTAENDRLLFSRPDQQLRDEDLPINRIIKDIDPTYGFVYKGDDEDEATEGQDYGMYELDMAARTRSGVSNPPVPVMSKADGNTNVFQWKSYSDEKLARKFIAWNKVTEVITPAPVDNGNAGDDGGLKQGTLPFSLPTPPPAVAEGCTEVIWDPEGRVFDAKTLQPITGATVKLSQKFNKTTQKKCTQGEQCTSNFEWRMVPKSTLVINPYTTGADGGFAFFVDGDAYYQLDAVKSGYTFPLANTADVNPAYTTRDVNGVAMYRELYTAANREIYQPMGKTVHRDIPVLSSNPATDSKIVPNLFTETNSKGQWTLTGSVSHPQASIKVYFKDKVTQKRKSLAGTFSADSQGRVNIAIDQKKYTSEVLGDIEITPFDASKTQAKAATNSDVMGVMAQAGTATNSSTLTLSVEPIPVYLEGYAYDSTGKVIPFAKVSVSLNYIDSPYYETVTNTDGSFRIASEHLPRTPYTIVFTSPDGKKNKITTGQFLAAVEKQQPLSKTQKYDPFTAVTSVTTAQWNKAEARVTGTPTQYYQGTGKSGSTATGANPSQTPDSAKTQSQPNNIILIAVILLVLLGGVGIILAIYLYKKNATPPPQY